MLRIDSNVIWEIINILILFFLVKKFLFKPVHNILDKRASEVEEQYKAAEQKNQEAETMKAQLAASTQKIADNEAAALEKSHEKASAEYDRIIAAANARSNNIITDAKARAKAAADLEKREAENQITAMVKEAAAKIAESRSDKELYDDFLQEVSTQPKKSEN